MFLTIIISSCTERETVPEQTQARNLDSLLIEFPDSVPLLLERGEVRFDNYDYEAAMEDAAKAFRLDSTSYEVRLLYAEVLNNREQRTVEDILLAQRHYEVIVKKQPKNLRALVGLAATHAFLQDFESAFKYVNEALRIDNKYRDAYVLKGSVYIQLGNMELAKSSYETAIQQDPEFFEAYFRLAQIYQSEGNPVCVEYYATANELKPDIAEVKYQLAYSKQVHGQIEGAKTIYREMTKDSSEFYVTRGYFHQAYIKQFIEEDLDSAMILYGKALQADPRHVESWHNLGICYDQKGDLSKALQSFGKALKYNPEFTLSREYADSLKPFIK
jgi:tetratricopeptide (TPR) repeat protein